MLNTLKYKEVILIKKIYKKLFFSTTVVIISFTGLLGSYVNPILEKANIITTAYASTVKFSDDFNPNGYGKKTEAGWLTSKVVLDTLEPSIIEDTNAYSLVLGYYEKEDVQLPYSIDELKKMSINIDLPEYADLFPMSHIGNKIPSILENMCLTDNIYYFKTTDFWGYVDYFVKIYKLDLSAYDKLRYGESPEDVKAINKYYCYYVFRNGKFESYNTGVKEFSKYLDYNEINDAAYDVLYEENFGFKPSEASPSTIAAKLYEFAFNAITETQKKETQPQINVARGTIKELQSTEAEWAMGEFSKQVDIVQQKLFERFLAILGKSQKTLAQADINEATTYIKMFLTNSDTLTYVDNGWSQAVDIVQQKLIDKAETAVRKAQKTRAQTDIDEATRLLNELSTSTNKDVVNWVEAILKELNAV